MAEICTKKGFEKPMAVLYTYFQTNNDPEADRIMKKFLQQHRILVFQICCEICYVHEKTDQLEKLVDASKKFNLPEKLKRFLHCSLIKSYIKISKHDKAAAALSVALEYIDAKNLSLSLRNVLESQEKHVQETFVKILNEPTQIKIK